MTSFTDHKKEAPTPLREGASVIAQTIEDEDTCGRTVLPHSPVPTPCIARPGHAGGCVHETEARDLDRVRDKLIARRIEAERWANRADDTTCEHGRPRGQYCGSCEFERQRIEAEQDMVYEGRAW
jgi:hypothetical protein